MFRNSKIQAKKVVLNHLLRNIDLQLAHSSVCLHAETQRKNEALKLIALAVRCRSESIHEYFSKDYELLEALPISLVTFISAKSENYELIKELKIDENEDLFITLHKPACKQLVREIVEHIIKNEEHYFEMFSNEISRKSCFVTFD